MAAGETEVVTLLRPPQRDPYGDPVPGTAAEVEVPGCLFAPGPSQELGQGMGANTVESDGTVYAPANTDIRNTDQLRIRGEVYEIVGRPLVWRGGGVVVPVRLVTG